MSEYLDMLSNKYSTFIEARYDKSRSLKRLARLRAKGLLTSQHYAYKIISWMNPQWEEVGDRLSLMFGFEHDGTWMRPICPRPVEYPTADQWYYATPEQLEVIVSICDLYQITGKLVVVELPLEVSAVEVD